MKSSLKSIFKKLPTIAVSLLDSDLVELAVILKKLEESGVEIFHLDVMDGHFVPNLTFGPHLIKCIRKHTKNFLDVHLMIENPQKYVLNFIDSGADLVVFHYESVKEKKSIDSLIKKIKKNDVFCGISIKPSTNIEKIFPFLDAVDLVLVMTVVPGFGGQKMIKGCLNKVRELTEYKTDRNLDFIISCDGGINEKNIGEVVNFGCDIPVIGNAIFSSANYVEKVKILQKLTNNLKFHT